MRNWEAVNLRGNKLNKEEGFISMYWRMYIIASLIIRLWSKASALISFSATQHA